MYEEANMPNHVLASSLKKQRDTIQLKGYVLRLVVTHKSVLSFFNFLLSS
jgi:hypothetical protein